MIEKIKENIWKINFKLFGSNVYLVKINDKNILIDTSSLINRYELKKSLLKLKLKSEDIDIVLMTHNHFDHTGNIKIFKNAKVYGSEEDFKKKILNGTFSVEGIEDTPEEDFKIKILPLTKFKLKEFEIIKTPGHTKGSICFYLTKDKVLFSGDHIFDNGYIGRTDLPNSAPEKMKQSLEIIKKVNYKTLCPGHEF